MPNIFRKVVYIAVIAAILVAGFAALPAQAETPTITRLEVTAISGSKATISWSTNQATTGIAHYGLAAASLVNFLGDSRLQQDHQALLINLQESKTYYFNVTARNAAGEETTSFTFTFATTKMTQAEKDEIRGLQPLPTTNDFVGVDGVSATVAAVSWTSVYTTKGFVTYNEVGQTRTRTVVNNTLNTRHQVVLRNLKPDTSYDFTVTMKDKDNVVTSVRGPFRFSTVSSRDQETTPLAVTYLGPASSNDPKLTPTTAVVAFSTNHMTTATVTYRSRGSNGSIPLNLYSFQHQPTLTNLKPNTEYEVTINARDPFGKTAKISALRFRTPAAAVAAKPTPRVASAQVGPVGRVIKSPSATTVYYVYPSGKKKPYATQAAFLSYGHTFSEVQIVSDADLAAIPDVRVIKSAYSPAIYKLEGAVLRPIVGADAFTRAGFSWSEIEQASAADIQSYPVGQPIT